MTMMPLRPTPLVAIALSVLVVLLHLAGASSDSAGDDDDVPSTLSLPCPVRLLDVPADDADSDGERNGGGDDHDLTLSPAGLSYLSSLPSPIYVVPALGVYRGGKSLLLNRVMNLTAPYSSSSGAEGDENGSGGFGVGHSQSTYTRGIDVCAEYVPSLSGAGQGGTVVWMDTEGLWSSQYSRGKYGPKLFSLALLFASTVILNSVKVLSDQFFDFFAEEQRVARILKAGLKEGGMMPGGDADAEASRDGVFLPEGLNVFWVLQQPITYGGADAALAIEHEEEDQRRRRAEGGADGTEEEEEEEESMSPSDSQQQQPPLAASAAALEAFLHRPGDELRSRVRRDFVHRMHEIPLASHDARMWDTLDTLPDDQLLPEYVRSTRRLREAILKVLPRSRPLSNATIASQMKMYLELVKTERYSANLAREVFEESEMTRMCDDFAARVCNLTNGTLSHHPVASHELGGAFIEARREAEPQADEAAETYHLGTEWRARLDRCLTRREADMRLQNSERIMDQWREEAGKASEGAGRCYFLGDLLGGGALLSRYIQMYNEDFCPLRRSKARDHARQLQRTRLMECVRLRDVLMPLAPLAIWLFCRAYLSGGTPSSLGAMIFHGVIFLGSYSFAQMTGQLPHYLDLDYAFLKGDEGRGGDMLDLVMRLSPSTPWSTLASVVRTLGTAFAVYKIVTYLAQMFRPAGAGREVHQLLNLELKVNRLSKFADASMRTKIVDSALEASNRIDADDGRGAFRSLLSGLAYAVNLGDEELAKFGVEPGFTRAANKLLKDYFSMPARGCVMKKDVREHKLDMFVLKGDLQKLLGEMMHIMGHLTKKAK